MKDTMPTLFYRNKDSAEWENILYLQAKSKACCLKISPSRKIWLVHQLQLSYSHSFAVVIH